MANTKISALTNITRANVLGTDMIPVARADGTNGRMSFLALTGECEYLNSGSNPTKSLAHITSPALGDTYRVNWFDANKREQGGPTVWKCVYQTSSLSAGTIVNGGSTDGIIMHGTGCRWQLQTAPGKVVDIRACGIVCDGDAATPTTGQEDKIRQLSLASQSAGITLTGAGPIRIAKTLDFRLAKGLDLSRVEFIAGTTGAGSTVPGGGANGDFYTAEGKNIPVLSMSASNPCIITVTNAALGAASASITEHMEFLIGSAGLAQVPNAVEIREMDTYIARGVSTDGTNTSWQFVPTATVDYSGRSQTNPVVISTSSPPDNGSTIWVYNDAGLNGPYTTANRVAGTSFELVGVNGTGLGAYAGGGTFRIAKKGAVATRNPWVGPNFVFIPPTENSNFATVDLQEWSGRIRRLGVALRVAGNGALREAIQQETWVRGDGNFDFTRRATCVGVMIDSDDSPLGRHNHKSSYCYVGICLAGELEKKYIQASAVYAKVALFIPGGSVAASSTDTLDMFLNANECEAFFWSTRYNNCAIRPRLMVEGRSNPGAWENQTDDRPSIWMCGGKHEGLYDTRIRAGEGLEDIFIDKADQGGVTHVSLNNVTFEHGYGRKIYVRRCRSIEGDVIIRQIDQGPNDAGSDTRACVTMARVQNAGNFHCSLIGITTSIGVEFGDGTYFSRDAHLGNYDVWMSLLTTIWDDNVPVNTGTNGFPTTSEAVRVRGGMRGCEAFFTGCHGNIVVDDGVLLEQTRKFRLHLPEHQKRYTRTVHAGSAANVELGFRVLADASGRLPISAMPSGLVVGGTGIQVTEANGVATVNYTGELGESVGGWVEKLLTSDIPSTDPVTLNEPTALQFTPEANGRYIIEAWFMHSSGAAGVGVQTAITVPSGVDHAPLTGDTFNTATTKVFANSNGAGAPGTTTLAAANSPTTANVAALSFWRGMLRAGASPGGPVKLGFKPENNSAEVTLLAGTVMRYRKVA